LALVTDTGTSPRPAARSCWKADMILADWSRRPFSARTWKRFLVISEYLPAARREATPTFLEARSTRGLERKVRTLASLLMTAAMAFRSPSTASSTFFLDAAVKRAVAYRPSMPCRAMGTCAVRCGEMRCVGACYHACGMRRGSR
jgi:hypothetical protein